MWLHVAPVAASARTPTHAHTQALRGTPWRSLALPGAPWHSLTLPDAPWRSLALPGTPLRSLSNAKQSYAKQRSANRT